MNVLLITTHLNYGGITSYIKSLAGGLKTKGHNVFVASSGGDCLDFFNKLKIPHFYIPIRTKSEISLKIYISFFKLLPFLKEKKIQIIHSQTRVTQLLGWLLSKFTKIPYISTCHGFFKPKFSRKLFGCWGRRVIAISESVKKHLLEDFDVKEDKIKLIYHGIDLNNSESINHRSQIKEKLGLKRERTIGIVARLSEVKGQRELIYAFKLVREEYPDVQLLIVGEGKIKPQLLDLVSELKIREDVLFLPPISDTSEILGAFDVFCSPSLKEGLGLSLMEAMGYGIPVIASKTGGITDLIEDGKTGLLVEIQDIKGLALAILRLLRDRRLAEDIRRNAKEFIRENFSSEKMVAQTIEVYKECLRENY